MGAGVWAQCAGVGVRAQVRATGVRVCVRAHRCEELDLYIHIDAHQYYITNIMIILNTVYP
jgi:hypothetical protein